MQYHFPFLPYDNFTKEDFIVSDENSAAYDFINQWPEWGSHRYAGILLLYGEKGCGKTHLAHIWQSLSEAVFLSPSELDEPPAAAIIEDIDNGSYREHDLLHYINRADEAHTPLMLTSSLAPTQITLSLADLRSRICAVPSLKIAPPSDELLHRLLVKQLTDRQLRIAPEAVHYILTRTPRSFSAITAIAAQLDHRALEEKRNITIPFIRETLSF